MVAQELIRGLGAILKARRYCLATAESCTGGWVAKEITTVPGCSHWFERGFVTYTNLAKQEMLGVRAETLNRHGAVSEQTVREMAEGALRHSHAQVALVHQRHRRSRRRFRYQARGHRLDRLGGRGVRHHDLASRVWRRS